MSSKRSPSKPSKPLKRRRRGRDRSRSAADVPSQKPRLTVAQILAWAEAHFRRTGQWPEIHSGRVNGAVDETWLRINAALYYGYRGLPGGSSLLQELVRHGATPRRARGPLDESRILTWAQEHFQRTGRWPQVGDGAIQSAAGENWRAMNQSLRTGYRGLPGGSSLRKLLALHGIERPRRPYLPVLTVPQILEWADKHFERTGKWPQQRSGRIRGARNMTWDKVFRALYRGAAGAARRLVAGAGAAASPGVRPYAPALDAQTIVRWAQAHFERTGSWPSANSGKIADAPAESWTNVNAALRVGTRGLPGGSSLAKLLAAKRASGLRSRRRN